MRMIRGLSAMLALPTLVLGACLALTPATSAAQKGRSFKDAWFWGLKGGGVNFSTILDSHENAPSIGADWVITRTRGGVYVSFDQAFFDRQTVVIDSDPFTGDLLLRPVDIENMQRVHVMAMGFPIEVGSFRPYFGLGLTMQHISSAEPEGVFQTAEQFNVVRDQIDAAKASFSPSLMLGGQWQLRGINVFAQGIATGAHRNFFLSDGDGGVNFSYEIGVRYNIGRSIDR